MTWRVGRKIGRTLYIQRDPEVPDCGDTNSRSGDVFVGLMDTPELAALVCLCVNSMEELDATLVQQVAPEAFGQTQRQDRLPPGPTVQRSVDPHDTGRPVVTVYGDDCLEALPEHDGPVPSVPSDADLPVEELHPLGDDADARDA